MRDAECLATDEHVLSRLGNAWIVKFKRRGFTRSFENESDARLVIEADVIYSKAERSGLYCTVNLSQAERQEIVNELRSIAKKLPQANVGDFTIREFEHAAELLAPP